MFFSAASVAGAFSGLLAFAISKMDGVGGLAGWRWIFILEGIVTVLVAFIAFFVLHDFPETATFLTEEERAFVVFRLKFGQDKKAKEEGRTQIAEVEDFQWKYVWQAFRDWQIWVNIFVYWGVSYLSLQTDSPHLYTDKDSDRLSSIRYQSIPPDDHRRTRLRIQHGSAPDSAYLHYSRDSGRSGRLLFRSRGQAVSLCDFLLVYNDRWLCDVHIDIEPSCRLRWRVYRRLLDLPILPRQHLVA